MNNRFTVQTFTRVYGKWVVLFAIPLVVNVALWAIYVSPQKKQLENVRRNDAMYTLVPKAERLLKESHQATVAWERSGPPRGDASTAIQSIRRLADQHSVQLRELAAERGSNSPLVNVQASGRFSRLALWLSAMERQPGLQVESWSVVSDGGELKLTAEVTAVLKDT